MMSDVMTVSRLRMGTDGNGVRTLMAFHGCPLNCKYCINRHCHNEEMPRAHFEPEELMQILSQDEPYYFMTGGGVTFGGGEPLLQAEFIHEVCQKMNKKWHCIIETSLYADWSQIELLIGDIDYWYVDIKDVNNEIYQAYTGKSNNKVLNNLKKLVNQVGAEKICVRIPHIPKFNTKEDRAKSKDYVLEKIDAGILVEEFEYIRC